YRTLGLRSSVGDPSVSPQTVFNPNHESTINNRKSIPVPAGPNVCSTIPERGHPSRRDGMFILTWHIRLTGHYIRYPYITLRPYRTLGLRSSVGDPSDSPQTVYNTNQKCQNDNQYSKIVPAHRFTQRL